MSYEAATKRPDLSDFVLHLTRPQPGLTAWDALAGILREWWIRPSMRDWVTKYEPAGASCFYDVPVTHWDDVVHTNPSGREGYGIAVAKQALWGLGGRPAIYTDLTEPSVWPPAERFRVVHTNLWTRHPDWTHEREWRVPHDFTFEHSQVEFVIVDTYEDVARFPKELKDAIGRDRFLIMDVYRQVERLWPVHIV